MVFSWSKVRALATFVRIITMPWERAVLPWKCDHSLSTPVPSLYRSTAGTNSPSHLVFSAAAAPQTKALVRLFPLAAATPGRSTFPNVFCCFFFEWIFFPISVVVVFGIVSTNVRTVSLHSSFIFFGCYLVSRICLSFLSTVSSCPMGSRVALEPPFLLVPNFSTNRFSFITKTPLTNLNSSRVLIRIFFVWPEFFFVASPLGDLTSLAIFSEVDCFLSWSESSFFISGLYTFVCSFLSKNFVLWTCRRSNVCL